MFVKVVSLISGWQADDKNGKFDHVYTSFEYAFARNYTDFMEYCEWVVDKATTKVYADDTYSRMMKATTSCGGDLEDWIKNSTTTCVELFTLLNTSESQAKGVVEGFAPFWNEGMTKDADEYDFGSDINGTTNAEAYATYQAMNATNCSTYCESIISNEDRQLGCANGCEYVKGASTKKCNNMGWKNKFSAISFATTIHSSQTNRDSLTFFKIVLQN